MIPVRILTDDDVKSILDIRSAIESVEKAYTMKADNKARQNSEVLLVAGTGTQAVFQIAAALSVVESFKKVYIFNPMRYESALRFQRSIKEELGKIANDFKDPDNKNWLKRLDSVEFIAVASPVEALAETDAVITITPSRKPLILKEWINPGIHFSCIGADMGGKQEIDDKILDDAVVFVDDIAQASTVGESQKAIREGRLCIDRLTEIGDLILGNSTGRKSDKDITVFDSTGIALQDLAISSYLVAKAEKMNIGTIIQI